MNVIISNKQKNTLDSVNIDAIKELNGLFNVDELINNVKGYFFTKIIIDATSIVDFAKEVVLRKLASGIGPEKIIILLPPKPEPPQRFCDFLNSLGIYNYSMNVSDIVNFIKEPNTSDNYDQGIYNMDVTNNNSEYTQNVNDLNNNVLKNDVDETVNDLNQDKKLVIGFKNITLHAGSTSLIYMIKQQLEKKYKMNVEAFELLSSDFKFFNTNNMYEVNYENLEITIKNSKSNIILVDLTNVDSDILCDDVIYLIEPSILKINKLLNEKRDVFTFLDNKKVVLNKSILNEEEVSIFAKEAGIKIYFSIPYINDRIDNQVINTFIEKMGIVNKGGQGLFGLFNKEN